jgi:ABC-type antimicrobial peptide transport system permease subunit
LTIGLAAGGPLAALINGAVPVAEAGGQPIAGIIPLSAALMVAAALLAIAGPTRRALRIDPTRALRVD